MDLQGLFGLLVIDTEHYLVPAVFQVFQHIEISYERKGLAWVLQGIPSLYTHYSHHKHVIECGKSPHPGAARMAERFQPGDGLWAIEWQARRFPLGFLRLPG